MNFQDFKSIKIGDKVLTKLVRTRDNLVIWQGQRVPQPYWTLDYDVSKGGIFAGNLFAGYYGGECVVEWPDGSKNVYQIQSGSSVLIRNNSLSGICTIKFFNPGSFFVPILASNCFRGITKLTDRGDNVIFRNTLDSTGVTRSGTFNWINLEEIDLRDRTSVPNLPMAGFFDSNTNLTTIVIPSSLEQQFRSNTNWNKYASKFVIA